MMMLDWRTIITMLESMNDEEKKVYSIAIDGPAGAGKTTTAKNIAKLLDFTYVDTGALYRTFAVYFLRNHISGDDVEAIEKACPNIHAEIRYDSSGNQKVFLNGEDVTDLIRTEEVSQMASVSSAVPAVREALLGLQRDMARKGNVVIEGRDIGSYVLPDAEIKIFLSASPEVRAKRRYEELKERGEDPDFDQVISDIVKRDVQDSTREIAPLKKVTDAFYINSSEMTIEDVTNMICRLILAKKGKIMFHVRPIENDCPKIGIVTNDLKKATEYLAAEKEYLIQKYNISEDTHDFEYDKNDLFFARDKKTGELYQVILLDIPVI